MDKNTLNSTVLIVDDDSLSLLIAESALSDICRVVCTSNPLEVIELCCTYLPSLILLDIEMPEMSGFDLCVKLKASELTKNIPIIFSTGHTTAEFEQKALAHGAVDFIPKPLHSGVLALRVKNHLKIVNQAQELEAANYKLHAEKEQLHVTLSSIGDAVIATNQNLEVTFINPTAERLTGWTSSEAIGQRVDEIMKLYEASTGDKLINPLAVSLREKRTVGMALNAKLVSKTGTEFRVEDSASPILDSDGKMIGGVIVFQDKTDAIAMSTQMSHLANHDQLTGLPNRMLLHDRMQLSIAESSLNQEQIAVLLIDIDNFKNLNDTLGHDAGDAIINHVARKLEEIAPVNATVSRVGGDEFVILLSDIHYLTYADKVAKEILEIASDQTVIQNQTVHLSVSIGISVYPHDASNPEQLMRHADTAMYKVKGEGKNNYAYYSPYLTEELTGRVKLEKLLREVIKTEQVQVFYQPKIDMHSKLIVGAEALARIVDTEQNLVPPDEFIPVAEETGMIIQLGEQILLKSCQQAKSWLNKGYPCKIAVNIAAAQFNNSRFCHIVESILKQCDLPPYLLELEITESAIIDDFNKAQETHKKMTQLGVSVALNDFGTGYSSLSYLRSFELDVLKIDKSFVKDATNDPQATSIVKAIINLAKSLHLELVCEGVETKKHEALMKKLGCCHAQGYLYSRPLNTADFWTFLKKSDISSTNKCMIN